MSVKRKVETFYCPVSELPEDIKTKKLKKINNNNNNNNDNNTANNQQIELNQRKIFEKIFNSVHEFGKTNTHKSKRKALDDKLTKLGAPPVKQHKMPFKMRIGILEGRKKREQYHIKEAKSSGQVLARKTKDIKKNKRNEENNNQPDWNVKTKGGVLRLSKSKLPPKLWKK